MTKYSEKSTFSEDKLKKLNALMDLKENPYPYSYNQTHHAREINEKYLRELISNASDALEKLHLYTLGMRAERFNCV